MNHTKVSSILNQYHARVDNLRTEDLLPTEHIARLVNIYLDLKVMMKDARVTTEEHDYILIKFYRYAYDDGWLLQLEESLLNK